MRERLMPRPKPEEPMARLTIVLPESVLADLKDTALDEATPVSVLVRRWIVERLKQIHRSRQR